MSRTFNDIIKDGSLDDMLENTRKLCSVKLQRQNVVLPTYVGREDVVQDAMIKVSRAYDKFDPNKASANTYFTRIIDRVIIDHIRKFNSQSAKNSLNGEWDGIIHEITEILNGNSSVGAGDKDAPRYNNDIVRDNIIRLSEYTGDIDEVFTELKDNLRNMFTAREMKILKLRYAGYTHEEIANKLNVSRPTVAKEWRRVRRVSIDYLKERI